MLKKIDEMSNLLRGNIECLSTHVYLLIDIDTGQYEEDAGAAGAASKKEAQPEDDRPFVLLHHLHHPQEREGEGDQDEEEREQSEED